MMLKLENCKIRQQRLLRTMEALGLDAAVITKPGNVYYFTGALVDASRPRAFVLDSAGNGVLITNKEPAQAAAKVELYTWYSLDRVVTPVTMAAEAAGLVRQFARGTGNLGLEFESAGVALSSALEGRRTVNITPALDEMIRVKDPDEIDCIRATIALAEAGYGAVRGRLEPGMTELQAYRLVYEAMVNHAGTSVALNGDFACGTRAMKEGGAPTLRKVLPGDLYIFDLFPVYDGYHCDLCRTFSTGRVSQLQQDAWAHIVEAHRIAARVLRPGARSSEVYREIKAHMDRFEAAKGSFWHHAGHGVGLNEWEFPWLLPGSDHVIQEGEVVACEPGLYSEALQGGLRLEHNYLIGPDGATPLDGFPLEL